MLNLPCMRYIVVTAYNEEKFLGRFLDRLLEVVPKYRVVVVDDGSNDQTGQVAKEHGVIVLSHLVNLGKGAAIKTGCDYLFAKTKASRVIIMDGDDQHDPADLKLFDQALKDGHQLAFGVRSLDAKMPFARVIGNKSMSILINLLFGRYLSDIPSGYKAFTKSAYKQILWHSAGYEVETEIAVRVAKNKLDYVEIPINTIYHGKDYGFNLLDAGRILLKLPYWLMK